MQLLMHQRNSLLFWHLFYVEFVIYKSWKFYQGLVDEILLEKFVFELTAAHQKPFKYQVKSLSRAHLRKICLEIPEKNMSNNPSII